MPTSFTFDLNRCTGCQACELACAIENQLDPAGSWRRVSIFNPRHHPQVPQFNLSLACNHCAAAPCVRSCPARAFDRDAASGAVLLDPQRCIGCRYCLWVCPYTAPRFDAAAGVMGKCTLCQPRLESGQVPACVAQCPTGALGSEELSAAELSATAQSQVAAGLPEFDCGPALALTPLRADRQVPECSAPPPQAPCPLTPAGGREEPGINWRSEWPLAGFTMLTTLLSALLAASMLTPLVIAPVGFVATALVAAGLAATHLGRKRRAWRAVLNLTSSWLSREVVGFALFVGLGTVYLWLAPGARVLGWTAVAVGFFTLLAIDQVYGFAGGSWRGPRHSAGTVLTGLFLTACLTQQPLVSGLFAIIKLALYCRRKIGFALEDRTTRQAASVVRIGIGLLLPAIMWLADPPAPALLVLTGILIGELVDRAEFYAELRLRSPQHHLTRKLESSVGDRQTLEQG